MKKLTRGDKLSSLSAAALNRLPDLIAAFDRGAKATTADPPAAARDNIVSVRNESGVDVPAFGVLGFGAAVFEPTGNLSAFCDTLALKGEKPTAKHKGKFAILLEPSSAGSSRAVAAIVAGVTAAKVKVGDEKHTHADIDPDQVMLKSAAAGGAQIIWKESGTGEKWAIVRIGGGGSGATIIVAKLHGPFADGKVEATLVPRDEEDEGEEEEEEETEEEEPLIIWDEDDLFPRACEDAICVAWLDGDKYRAIFCQQIGFYAKANLAGDCAGTSPATIINFQILSPPPFHLSPVSAPTEAENPRGHRGATGRKVYLAYDETSETWQIVDMELVDAIVLAKVGSDGPLRFDSDKLQGYVLTIGVEHCGDSEWIDLFSTTEECPPEP